MRSSLIVILALVGATGCAQRRSMVSDYRLYDTGEVRTVGMLESEGGDRQTGLVLEYFKNGRLKRSEFSHQGTPWMVVTFHENGRMESEERLRGDRIAFGAYYAEDGTLLRQVGRKID